MGHTDELMRQYGLLFVLGSVLFEQLGVPIPSIPILLLAGAASARGEISITAALLLSVFASLVGDSLWYEVGRKKGGKVLSTVCRISLNPDSCVRQMESLFERWGFPSLLIAKFIPGFSMVAPPIAGYMKKSRSLFWLFSGVGAGLWSGSTLVTGFIFSDAIEIILSGITRFGRLAGVAIVLVFFLFVLVKYLQRRRLYQSLRMPRISPEDLKKLIDEGQEPIVLDVRSEVSRSINPVRIPGAREILLENLQENLGGLLREREIVAYCSCPNEASAALLARELMNQGFQKVRPLEGGLDAWREAGYPVEGLKVAPIAQREVSIEAPISGEK